MAHFIFKTISRIYFIDDNVEINNLIISDFISPRIENWNFNLLNSFKCFF